MAVEISLVAGFRWPIFWGIAPAQIGHEYSSIRMDIYVITFSIESRVIVLNYPGR